MTTEEAVNIMADEVEHFGDRRSLTLIDRRRHKRDPQHDYVQETWSGTNGLRLRVTVRIDHSYEWQGSGMVERWDGSQWQEVASLEGVDLGALPDASAMRLLEMAWRVISDGPLMLANGTPIERQHPAGK